MKTMSFGTLMLLLLLNYSGYTTAIRKCPMSLSKYSFCNPSPASMPSEDEQPIIIPPPTGLEPVPAPEPSKPSGKEPTTAPAPAPEVVIVIDIEPITPLGPAPEPSKPSGKEPTAAPVPAPGPSIPSDGEPAPPELPRPNNA
ncbi:uncharacterized protein LOC141655996 [Silene latifolia]|uniref:uncharacterized protein LOC141655996 n=1 Tax=Silene latifolia TaxID=37657 RepID=UPI003D77E0B5